uniref:Ymf76 n=1 Tax=Tetrahymena rostrata TaxID=5909 RepID=UPI00207A3BD0|nr:Ymf76 [Tetrahymena rostrata]URP31107.1 Ymf76 [Tetrahymena rostrata]
MYLKWLKLIKTKNTLKKIYKKYGYFIIKNVYSYFYKNNKLKEENKIITFLLKIIKNKKILFLVKKNLTKKIKIHKLKLKKRKRKFKFPKLKLITLTKTLHSKKKKINKLLYFLKYFLIFKKRFTRLFNLSKIKSRLSKRRFFKKKIKIKKIIKYFKKNKNNFDRSKNINLAHVDYFFNKQRRYKKLDRLHDIKKKYIRYLDNNRSIYKIHKYRSKHNFKFIKRHIRSISSLSIKTRFHMYEYSLRNIALKLRYAYTYRNANMFVQGGFIFLNGEQETNPLKFIHKGDMIELVFSKFIFKLKKKIKKKIYISMRKYKKYNWKTLKNKVEKNKRRLRISRFGEKILHYKSKLTKSFQIDFRTMTFMLINHLNVRKDTSYLNKKTLPIYLLKLLNWKLTT